MLWRQGITGWQKWLELKIKRLSQAANLMPADWGGGVVEMQRETRMYTYAHTHAQRKS